MTIDQFKKSNDYRIIKCKCCTYCRFYRPNPYEFGGNCVHPDMTEQHSYLASVDDFGLCNKFKDL